MSAASRPSASSPLRTMNGGSSDTPTRSVCEERTRSSVLRGSRGASQPAARSTETSRSTTGLITYAQCKISDSPVAPHRAPAHPRTLAPARLRGIPPRHPPFALTVLAERSLRALTPRFSVERGDAYFAQGRVGDMDTDDGVIEATVRGSLPYHVELAIEDDDMLTVHCECAFYRRSYETCKHIWATIRAASARNLLPDRAFQGILQDDRDDDDDDYDFRQLLPYNRGPRAPWERFLQAIGPARDVMPGRSRGVPDEIAYVISSSPTSQALMLRLLARSRKKDGEWGKWKSLSMSLSDLHALEPFDRATIGLLHQRSYGYEAESSIVISPSTTEW